MVKPLILIGKAQNKKLGISMQKNVKQCNQLSTSIFSNF